MGHFQGGDRREGGFRGGNGGGRPNFHKKSFGGGRDRETSMHKAICSDCNKSCEVPFRPTGEKPVYCSDCFSNRREEGDRAPKRDFNSRPAQNNSFAKPAQIPVMAQDDTNKQLKEINIKLDRLITVMERLSQYKTEIVSKVTLPKVEIKKTPILKTVAKKVVVKKVVNKKAVVTKIIAKKKK